MFSGDLERCTGFYRQLVEVSYSDIAVFTIVFVALTFILCYFFYELFIKKKSHRLLLLLAMGIVGVFTFKLFLPITEYFIEIPFYSEYDCTFNVLMYQAPFNASTDLLFIYARLLSLLVIPVLLLMIFTRSLIKTIEFTVDIYKKRK